MGNKCLVDYEINVVLLRFDYNCSPHLSFVLAFNDASSCRCGWYSQSGVPWEQSPPQPLPLPLSSGVHPHPSCTHLQSHRSILVPCPEAIAPPYLLLSSVTPSNPDRPPRRTHRKNSGFDVLWEQPQRTAAYLFANHIGISYFSLHYQT